MGGLNPRARQRVQTVTVRPTVKPGTSNAELHDMWQDAMPGKLGKGTVKMYSSVIKDAQRYFTTDDGREIPVAKWGKSDVWGWVHFIEGNYCGNFKQIAFREPILAKCKALVWKGTKPAEEAAEKHCGECPSFKRPLIRHRLHAVDKWFGFLARIGVIPVNFMPDIINEWYEENPNHDNESVEKKRNPLIEEQVALVNGTAHPMRRFLYALTAKNGPRPHEPFRLDRYLSFGLKLPERCPTPRGFENGYAKHPELASFEDGGEWAYIPEKVDEQGRALPDKRKGNRWMILDTEIRPLAEQAFAWWERTVQRHTDGRPVTTGLIINDQGKSVELTKDDGIPPKWNEQTYYRDAERLGLMKPMDREDPRRKWAGHCQRHSHQRLLQQNKVPSDRCNHLRGDAFRDSRGDYYKPEPQEVSQIYHEHIPLLGFKPLPDAPRLRPGIVGERETHRAILKEEITRARKLKRGKARVLVSLVTSATGEAWTVSRRLAPSVAFALRLSMPGAEVRVTNEGEAPRYVNASELALVAERALALLV